MADSDETPKGGDEPKAKAEEAAPVAPENRRARRAARSRGDQPAERRRPVETRLAAGERVDDAFARAADGAMRFLKERFNVLQWLIVLGAAGWIGWQIYSWRTDKGAVKAALEISEAMAAELGRVGVVGEEKRDDRGALDTRQVFATEEARLEAAAAAYRKVVESQKGKPAASLAKLGLAGVLFDQAKYDEALKAYEEVRGSELAKTDPESRGRTLEGMALCLEAKGDKDGALKRLSELENAEISGFRELALYHQGRLLHDKGDDAAAKERLKKVVEKLGKDVKPGAQEPNYLLEISRDLLQRIDPSALPPPSSDEALQKALEQFQKKLPPGMSRVPVPVPTGPTP